jgi:hypothetical protein
MADSNPTRARDIELSFSTDGGSTFQRLGFAPLGTIQHGEPMETERVPYVELDLLRRYVRLIVQSEGSDLLQRIDGGFGVDVHFSPAELALLSKLSEEACK